MTTQVQGDQVREKTFNRVQGSDGSYSYGIQSSLKKEEMIKIAVPLTPSSDELIRQIPGPHERGT